MKLSLNFDGDNFGRFTPQMILSLNFDGDFGEDNFGGGNIRRFTPQISL